MSLRTCLVEREEHGDRIRRVRLLGQHAEAVWESPRVDAAASSTPEDEVRSAAEWIAQRLSVDGDRLGPIVLDTTGAHCAWVQAATADVGAVRAAYGRGGESALDEFESDLGFEDEQDESDVLGGRLTPLEASIETLGPAYESGHGVRIGVVVAPDAVARLLLDELDDRGISPSGVTTLWHALALAASPIDSDKSTPSRVVAESPTVGGCVLVQPEGNLLWAWGRAGCLLAAGSMRLAVHDDGPIVARQDLARLVNDWVAWSAQVGVSPARVLVLSCPLAVDRASSEGRALSAPGVASALADLWPEAVLDIEVDADPARAALRRAEGLDTDDLSPGRALVSLATRPGRSLRRGYQLLGLALAMAGVALIAVGYRWHSQVEGIRSDASSIRLAYMAEIETVEAMLGKPGVIRGDMVPMMRLASEIDQATRASEIRRAAPRPVLEELEGVSLLLQELGGRVELTKIEITTAAFQVTLSSNDAAAVGDINRLLNELDLNGRALRWRVESLGRGASYTVRMIGTWEREGAGR